MYASGIYVPHVFSLFVVIQVYDERYPAPLLYKARATNDTKRAAIGSHGSSRKWSSSRDNHLLCGSVMPFRCKREKLRKALQPNGAMARMIAPVSSCFILLPVPLQFVKLEAPAVACRIEVRYDVRLLSPASTQV